MARTGWKPSSAFCDALEERHDLHRLLVARAQRLAEAVLAPSRSTACRRARARCGSPRCRRSGRPCRRRGSRCRPRSSAPRWRSRRSRGCWRGTGCPGPRPSRRRRPGPRCRRTPRSPGITLSGLSIAASCCQARVGHFDDAHVGLDGAERIVLRRDAGLGERVEERRLADVGQADDAALQAHGFSFGDWAPSARGDAASEAAFRLRASPCASLRPRATCAATSSRPAAARRELAAAGRGCARTRGRSRPAPRAAPSCST